MTPRSEPPPQGRPGPDDVLAFLCELAMLAALAVVGWHLGWSTPTCWILAIALPLAVVVGWGLTMAPTAHRRLPDPARLVAQIVLFLAVGAALAWIGHVAWGVTSAVVSIAAFASTRRPRRTAP